MTTALTFTVVDHTSDAGFRAWVAEIIAQLAAVGAVQTSDTGQINTSTVTRPGTTTTGGYAIFHDPGSLLYVKFEFGTGATATVPRILVTVGTGSDGSGTITGQTNTASQDITHQAAPSSTSVSYTSAFCCKSGYFYISWKEGAVTTNHPLALMILGSSVNSSQTPNSDGFMLSRKANSSNCASQSVRTASPPSTQTGFSWSSSVFALTCIPGAETQSFDSAGNNQAYLWWMNIKDVRPFLWACTVVAAEIGAGTTFSVALIGTTARTYRATVGGTALSPLNNSIHAIAALWE